MENEASVLCLFLMGPHSTLQLRIGYSDACTGNFGTVGLDNTMLVFSIALILGRLSQVDHIQC